ncbi:MAG: cytochrome d ubiquinol oxidase subunit II [Acidibacillus sp.]|nr:cytochrome d ubiquinol oxidase subunit II [Acidibacillus sp.]
MNLSTFGAGFLWLLVLVYSILAAIDFGSSYWRWHFHLRGNWRAETVAVTYVSPTWELINSFLVVIPVALVGLFPVAAFAYGTVLALPATILLILLALRGAYLQFGYASSRFKKQTIYIAGITGFLLPGVFISLLPMSQGGYVTQSGSNYVLLLGRFFSSPVVYIFMAFGISLALYLSALFLARYADLGGLKTPYQRFRKAALLTGPLSLFLGALAFTIPTPNGIQLMAPSGNNLAWEVLMTISILSFIASFALLFFKRSRSKSTLGSLFILGLAITQIITAQSAYAISHAKYILYPLLTFHAAASNTAMFTATLLVLIVGLAVMTPGLLWFRRLFIVDAKYVATHTSEPH